MKRIAVLTLFAVALCRGQQSAVIINAPTPAIRGVTIGSTWCYFYSQLPGLGSVHVGCWDSNVLTVNAVVTVTAEATGAHTFGWDLVNKVCPSGVWCGTITWIFTPGIAPNSINYKITGTVLPDPGNEPSSVGTF